MFARKRIDLSSIIITTFLALFAIACLFPMLLTLMVSVTDENSILQNGYSLFPDNFSLEAYRTLLNNGTVILRSYMITIFVTAVGTVLAVCITAMAGYTLSNPQVKYRGQLNLYFFITMLFQGGLVPWYLMAQRLGLTDNMLSLIVPTLMFNVFNMFLVRNYMESLPAELRESAHIDGANDMRIAFNIYFPLAKPVLATIALFYALAYWNDWFNAAMLLDDQTKYPLQYVLFRIRSNIDMLSMIPAGATGDYTPPTESVKMAAVIITIGPIIFLYPYLQKYFVKGLVVGSVKG